MARKEHHRNYPFRPPFQEEKQDAKGNWPLYKRLYQTYIRPQKWPLILAAFLIGLNASSSYLMSFYTKIIVDKILIVRPDTPPPQRTSNYRLTVPDREKGRPPTRPIVSMGKAIDRPLPATQRPPDAGRRLFRMAVIFIATQLLFNYLARLSTRQQIIISQRVTGQLRENIHQKILDQSISYQQTMSPGRLLSRILSDVDAARLEVLGLFRSSVSSLTLLSIGVCIIFYQDWRFGFISLVCPPLFATFYILIREKTKHYNQEIRHTNSCLYGLVSQKLDAAKAIQAYVRESGELLAFHRIAACSLRDTISAQAIASLFTVNVQTLTNLASCTIFLYGGYLSLHGQMTLGKLLFIQSVSQYFFGPITEVIQLPFTLQRLHIAIKRVTDVLESKIEITDPPNAVPFPTPLRHGVEIRGLYFSYPILHSAHEQTFGAANAPRKLPDATLKGINLFVPAGEWLCIMGASGTGKTTLLNLLARLYDPTFGQILLDGIDLKTIKLASLRKNIGLVPQEAQIFSGSMRDNICYGRPEATNEQIMDAAKAAQMHDFIMEMKVQYETLIGQKGSSLSGGQRQRLSLARALLTNPHLLLLDDCTSALDANTERKIQDTLAKILVGKTAIMVSQRVTMAMRCHKIAVLADGIISEYGTHQELLGKGGFYATLFREQTQ